MKTIKRGDGTSPLNGPYEVKVFSKSPTEQYAYVCQDNSSTYYIDLIDALADTTDPFRGVHDFASGSRIHNLQICAGNSTLFLSDLALNSSILVYDIRTGAPVFLASIPIPQGPPPSQNRRSHDLYVTGSRIYSASNDQGLTIFDYTYNGAGGPFNYSDSNTRNHFYNARRDQAPNNFSSSPMLPIAHNVWPSTNGNYLFATDERNGNDTLETSGSRQLGANLRVWNIGNIDAPPDANGYRYPISKAYQAREIAEPAGTFASSFLGALPAGEFGNSIHNVHIKSESGSDLAYITHYTKGLRILNVATPTSATEIGWYDVPNVWPYIFKVYGGSWGVYPYFTSGAIIVSDARGLYVFRRATEVSGTISTNTTWSGAIFVTNSITVNNNAMLTIQPGATVAFADGKSLTVNAGAKIIADGASTQTIKFTSNSHPPARAKWGNIVLYSTGNVFDYCTVEYGNQSIKILNGGATISNCIFQQNDQGIRTEYSNTYVSNCELLNNRHAFVLIGQNGNGNSATIYNCHAKDNDRDGIYASGYANGIIKNTHLEQNGKGHVTSFHGVYASNNCNLTFYDPELLPSSGLNTIRNNEGAGVFSYNSTVSIGLGAGSNKRGDQAIFGNGIYSGQYNGKQIYVSSGASTLYAQWIYWGAGQCPSPSSFFFGNVDRANCLTTSPTGFSKIIAGSDSTMDSKTLITQLKGYLLDQSGVPAGFDSLSIYDALALYFSMIRNDGNEVLQERSQTKDVLQYVHNTHKGNAAGDKAFQALVGYEMI
ncbi:MAG: right-handed parallel beta-helix repeat-containing protein [candidate division KSB1 bacterium]